MSTDNNSGNAGRVDEAAVRQGLGTIAGPDGTLRNVRWRRSANLLISAIDFNTFFGGPDPAVVDSVCYMKGFALHEMAG